MKSLFLSHLIVIGAFCHSAHGQVTTQNYFSSNQLEINYQRIECHDVANDIHKSIISLEFVNLTSDALTVSFNKELWYNGKCNGCNNSLEQQFSLLLDSGQTIAGTCNDKRTKSIYIVEKMLQVNSSVLTKFELKNISIQIVE